MKHHFFVFGNLTLSAGLCALSFAPFNLWPLGFIALWPVFYLIDHEKLSAKKVVSWWVAIAIALNVFAYYWVIYTIEVFGHLPLPIAFLFFLLYAVGTGTRFFIFFFLVYLDQQFNVRKQQATNNHFTRSKFLKYTLFWGLSELLGWQLFPFYGSNLVSSNLLFVQIADITGIRLLSLFWFVVNYSLYMFAFTEEKKRLVRWRLIGPAIAILLITHIYGILRYHHETNKISQSEKLRVIVPQGNTPLSFSEFRNARQALYETTTGMVEQTLRIFNKENIDGRPTDLVVWPESSVPFLSLGQSTFLQQQIKGLQATTNLPLIFNDVLYDFAADKVYSNMSLLDVQGEPIESYQKVFLLPFGEFMPLGSVFPFLVKAFPEVSNFSHGSRFVLFDHPKAKLLPVICYEIIPSNFLRHFYKVTGSQAEVMINITNDAWFGDTIESYQHLELGKLRAIELRMPIVRATNSGISAYIDSAGRTMGETPLFEKADRVYTVDLVRNGPTFYAKWGELWFYLLLLFGSAYWLYSTLGLKYQNQK